MFHCKTNNNITGYKIKMIINKSNTWYVKISESGGKCQSLNKINIMMTRKPSI